MKFFLIVALIVVAFFAWAVRDQHETERTDYEKQRDAEIKKVAAGPHVTKTIAISDTEEVNVLVIPKMGALSGYFETECIIYRNRDFKTSNLSCVNVEPPPGNAE